MQILISITELFMTLSIAVLTILYVIYTRKTLTAASCSFSLFINSPVKGKNLITVPSCGRPAI